MISYYLKARTTLLISLYKGFSDVLTESIALGAPIIAFDCPNGPSEMVQEGVSSYLVRQKPHHYSINLINALLEIDSECNRVQNSSKKLYCDKFF